MVNVRSWTIFVASERGRRPGYPIQQPVYTGSDRAECEAVLADIRRGVVPGASADGIYEIKNQGVGR